MKKILYMIQALCLAMMGYAPMLQPDLQRFADGGGAVVNTTTGTANAYTGATTAGTGTTDNDMSIGMKTYYDTELLENAREEAVYGQLGKSQNLPANHGKSVEWRKWNTLPEPDKLQEGVIPEGKKFGQSRLDVEIAQYGEYVTVSDQLELHHVDDVILGATEEVGAAMGKKADLLTRDAILAGCSNVLYAPDGSGAKPVQVSGVKADCLFTPDVVAKAVTILKKGNAPKIDGKYVAVVHPSVAYDLRKSEAWISYHQYDASTEIFTGEIGELHGVRFVEANTAPVMEGGASGALVYGTMIFGRDAFGVVDPAGAGMEMIIKSKDQAGGPLNQFSTIGGKMSHAAKVLYPERMLCVYSSSSLYEQDEANWTEE